MELRKLISTKPIIAELVEMTCETCKKVVFTCISSD